MIQKIPVVKEAFSDCEIFTANQKYSSLFELCFTLSVARVKTSCFNVACVLTLGVPVLPTSSVEC